MTDFANLQADALSAAGFVNENGLIPTRYGGNKKSWQYLVDQFETEFAETLLDINKSRGFRVVGTFAAGFEYELFNDVGIDASGNSWIYVGSGAPAKTVTAGTVPSAPDYQQVTFNSIDGVVGLRDELDDRPLHSTLAELQSRNDLSIGQSIVITDRDSDYTWLITSDTPNTFDKVDAGGGLTATCQYTTQVSLGALGAREDETTDDSDVVEYAASLGISIVCKRYAKVSRNFINTSSFVGLLDPKLSGFAVESGATVDNLFDTVNADASFYRVGFKGANQSTNASGAGALRFNMTASATEQVNKARVEECYFENFKQGYWILFLNNSNFAMNEAVVESCEFHSKTGNSIDPSSQGIPACMVGVQGNRLNLSGAILGISIDDNVAYGAHVKSFAFVWSNCRDGSIDKNRLYSFGSQGVDDSINYAIAAYTNRYLVGTVDYDYDPARLTINNNVIVGVRDVGIYLQGLNESEVASNIITGQTNGTIGTLLKGAIVTNGAHRCDVHHNTLFGNAIDLALGQINYKSDREITLTVGNNKCMSQALTNVVIVGNSKADGNTGSGLKSTLRLIDNTINGGVQYRALPTADNFWLYIEQGEIYGQQIGFQVLVTDTDPTPTDGIHIYLDGIDFHDITQDAVIYNKTWATMNINDNNFDMATITNIALDIQDSAGVNWTGNVFWASKAVTGTSKYCVLLTNAEYTSHGNVTRDLEQQYKELGFVAPTWAAKEGDRVQSLRVSEQGTSPNKFIVMNYIYAGNINAWVPERMYTGN